MNKSGIRKALNSTFDTSYSKKSNQSFHHDNQIKSKDIFDKFYF